MVEVGTPPGPGGGSSQTAEDSVDAATGRAWLACYNFSPRFRDLDDQRFWRATMPGVATGHYGAVEDLARNRVNLNKVITHWPDMLKVAGSLVTNQVRAYDLLRMFGRDGRPTPLRAPAVPSPSWCSR
jgi:TnpA family transposase